jgi:protein-S-isoprenylcysteine O-methyltransferase Ste14
MNIETKIPPPVIALLVAAAMWSMSSGAHGEINAIRIVGIVIFWLMGSAFALSGVISFRKARTTVNPLKPETSTALVISGVYKISRNPMYVGMALLLVAWAVYLGYPLTLLGVVAFVAYIHKYQVLPEERAMYALFGEQFTEYAKKVRRWL